MSPICSIQNNVLEFGSSAIVHDLAINKLKYHAIREFRAYCLSHDCVVLCKVYYIVSLDYDNAFKFRTKVCFFIIENGNALLKSPLNETVPVIEINVYFCGKKVVVCLF
jgi:hypothetical protein